MNCLSKQNSTNATNVQTDCLPVEKPDNCSDEAWQNLLALKKSNRLEQCHFFEGI